MIDLALESIRPGAKWALNGNTYEELEWLDTVQEKPTLEEINEEIVRIKYRDYQQLRYYAYPSFADQFDLLYHGGYDAWKNAIEEIKLRYPKPE